jgi:hypothetical protein
MKPFKRPVIAARIVAAGTALLLAVAARAMLMPLDRGPGELTFTADGDHWVVTLGVEVNGGPALVQTTSRIDHEAKVVELHYVIIQNSDLYVRCMKTVQATWKIDKVDRQAYTFRRIGNLVVVDSKELAPLVGKGGRGGCGQTPEPTG